MKSLQTKLFKKQNLFAIFSIFIGLTIITTIPVRAADKQQTSLHYYKNLFISWGLGVNILPTEEDKLATLEDIKNLYEKASSTLDYKQQEESVKNEQTSINQPTLEEKVYLLMLENQIKEAEKLQKQGKVPMYQKVIIITKNYPKELSLNLNFNPENILSELEPKIVEGKTIYEIPEVYLASPELRKQVANYFTALAKSEKIKGASPTTSASKIKNLARDLRGSSLLESALYAIAIFLIFAAFYRFFLRLVQNPRSLLQKDLYKQFISNLIGIILSYRPALVLTFLILASIYIPIIISLFLRSGSFDIFNYLQNYILSVPKILKTGGLNSQNILKLGFLLYNYILACLAFVLIIPNIYDIFIVSKVKIGSVKFKSYFVKWTPIVFIVTTIYLLAFFPFTSLISFVSLSGVIVMLMIYYIHSKKISYPHLFSVKEKFLLFGLLFLGIGLNFVWPIYKKGRPIKYVYEPLIGIKDDIVMLPYSKKWGQGVLFEPHYYNGKSLIFADGYLIFAPNVNKIVNKPIKDFAFGKNFVITTRDTKKTIAALLQKPELIKLLETDKVSPVFTFKDFKTQDLYDKNLDFELTFNCASNPDPTTIKIEIASLNKLASNNQEQEKEQKYRDDEYQSRLQPIENQAYDILNFPGCDQNTSFQSFKVPMDPFLIPQDNFIVRIRGIDIKNVLGVKIYSQDEEVKLTFINSKILNESAYNLVYQNLNLYSYNSGDEVINYSTEIKKNLTFDITYHRDNNQREDLLTSEGFNISEPINYLMKQKLLNNPFIIWSNKLNEIIRLDY